MITESAEDVLENAKSVQEEFVHCHKQDLLQLPLEMYENALEDVMNVIRMMDVPNRSQDISYKLLEVKVCLYLVEVEKVNVLNVIRALQLIVLLVQTHLYLMPQIKIV